MNGFKLFLLLLGMTAVTYIPRAIPAAFIEKMRFGRKMEKFLKLIPYAAMSAMIFPGVFTVDAAHPAIGIVGGVTAGILAWRKKPVMLCVLSAIAADLILYLLIP